MRLSWAFVEPSVACQSFSFFFLFFHSHWYGHFYFGSLSALPKNSLNFLVLSLSIRCSVSASPALVFFFCQCLFIPLSFLLAESSLFECALFACSILPPISHSQRRFLQFATTTRLSNKKFANLFMLINNKQINWKSKTERMKMQVRLWQEELVQRERKRGWQINLCDLFSQRASSFNWRDQITEPADCLPKASLAPIEFLYLKILLERAAACSFSLRLSLVVSVCLCMCMTYRFARSISHLIRVQIAGLLMLFPFWRCLQFNVACSTNQHFLAGISV